MSLGRTYYIFLDEGGNLDFSLSGTRYFTLTSVLLNQPFPFNEPLQSLRLSLLERGVEVEYFHASEDTQATRNEVFAVLTKCLLPLRVDSVIVDKRKTGPSLRTDDRFYPEMVGYLLQYVFNGTAFSGDDQFVVITDTLPLAKKRKVIEKALKIHLKKQLPKSAKFTILHHSSKAWWGLQVADYFNWAIYRAWTNDDRRSLDLVRPAVRSQFDIFQSGTRLWY